MLLKSVVTPAFGSIAMLTAETSVNGKSRDLLIDPTGTTVEVEQEVAFESLPAPAQGPVVSYEGVVQKGGRKSEVAVNADGTKHKED